MHQLKTLALFALIFFTQIGFGQEIRKPSLKQIDSLFGDWTDETKPGISVGMLYKGKLEFQKSWGLANLEHNIPITDKTVFLFPDMSAQMLAFSILLLEEKTKLNLNDPITNYISSLPQSFSSIQIKHLLNHNSGIADIYTLGKISSYLNDGGLTEIEFNKLIKSSSQATNLKELGFDYNEANQRLLQLILEAATGKKFNEFVQIEIFDALGMNSSYISSDHKIIKNKAQGYTQTGTGFLLNLESEEYHKCDQLYTTIEDICSWEDNFWRAKIGSERIWKKMDNLCAVDGKEVEEKNQAMYLGQHSYWDYRGEPKLYQIGVTDGYAAKMIRFPKHELAIVVLGNFGRYNGNLASIASNFYLEDYFNPIESTKEKPEAIDIKNEMLSSYEGEFWDYEYESLVKISLEDDTLRYYSELYDWHADLLPLGEDKFFISARAIYYVDFDKSHKQLTLNIPGRDKVLFNKISSEPFTETNGDLSTRFYSAALNTELNLVQEGSNIYMLTSDLQKIAFKRLSKDFLNSTDNIFTRINLVRNKTGEVLGFHLSNSQVKNIYFESIEKRKLTY